MKEFDRAGDYTYLETAFEEGDISSEGEESPSQEELEALYHQMHTLKTLLKQSQEETRTLRTRLNHQDSAATTRERQRYEALQRTLQEKEERLSQLEEYKVLYQRAQEHVHTLQLDLQQLETEKSDELDHLYQQLSALKDVVKKQEELGALNHQKAHEMADRLSVLEEEKRQAIEQSHREAETLATTRAEVEVLKQAIEQAIAESRDTEAQYQNILIEKNNLLDQLENVKQQVLNADNALRLKDEKIHEAETFKQRSKQQLQTLEQQLGESQKQQCHLQTALTDLRRDRESLSRVRSALEADYKQLQQQKLELEVRLQQAHEEKAKKTSELQQQAEKTLQEQRQRQECESELAVVKQQVQEQHQAQQLLRQELHVAEGQQKQLVADLASMEGQHKDLSAQILRLQQEKATLERELSQQRQAQEASTSELQMAQQHLAKKVKEASRTAEKLDEANIRIRNLDVAVQEAKQHHLTLTEEMEQLRKREKETEQRCEQQILQAAATAKQWETDYTRVYGQWQQAEEAVKKLRELEHKYNQVSSILSNLGQFFDPPAPHTPTTEPSASNAMPPTTETQSPPSDTHQDLFSAPQSPKRPKRNLFDL